MEWVKLTIDQFLTTLLVFAVLMLAVEKSRVTVSLMIFSLQIAFTDDGF